MLFGWGVLLPLGTAMSAGLRDALGSKRWYVAHRNMQIVGLLVAIVGVALALSLQKPLPSYGAHGKLGVVVMVLGILQPINGLLRPGKTATDRRAWEVVHKGVGWLALLLAGVTIVLGVPMFDLQEQQSFPGVAPALATVYGIVVVLLIALIVRGYCCGGHASEPFHKLHAPDKNVVEVISLDQAISDGPRPVITNSV